MKYKFVHNGRAWWLMLTTHEDVEAYIKSEWARMRDRVLKDYDYHIEHNLQDHWADGLAEAIDSIMSFEQIPTCKQYFEYYMDAFVGAKFRSWVEHINQGKTIYVNLNGGYNFAQPVLAYEERNECVFPCYSESDIRVKRWPGGKHFYAYVGNIEVTDIRGNDVINKWDDELSAKEAARRLLGSKGKK